MPLATHIPTEKIFLSGNLRCFTKKAAILLLSWRTFIALNFHSILKVENVLNFVCWFSFDTSCPKSMFKIQNFKISGFSAKEASTFHLYFSFCIKYFHFAVSWFLIVYFTLSLVTQIPRVKRFHSQSPRCSTNKEMIFRGHPEKWHESC